MRRSTTDETERAPRKRRAKKAAAPVTGSNKEKLLSMLESGKPVSLQELARGVYGDENQRGAVMVLIDALKREHLITAHGTGSASAFSLARGRE